MHTLSEYDFASEFESAIAGMQVLATPAYVDAVEAAGALLAETLRAGRKILICGNGGSASDAQHIAAELVGRYKCERPGLPAIALTTDSSVLTAWSNDYSFDTVFSRQVEALAQAGDLVWGISTSGNSRNVSLALAAARAAGCKTLSLLGRDGGAIKAQSDVAIVVPLHDTPRIQECHVVTYHALCGFLDLHFKAAV